MTQQHHGGCPRVLPIFCFLCSWLSCRLILLQTAWFLVQNSCSWRASLLTPTRHNSLVNLRVLVFPFLEWLKRNIFLRGGVNTQLFSQSESVSEDRLCGVTTSFGDPNWNFFVSKALERISSCMMRTLELPFLSSHKVHGLCRAVFGSCFWAKHFPLYFLAMQISLPKSRQ